MASTFSRLKKVQDDYRNWKKPYKKLQKHLDKMPIGFPSAINGSDLRVLRSLFTIPEAEAAIYLNYKPEPLETIYNRVDNGNITKEELKERLDDMLGKGSIIVKEIDNVPHYSLVPFVYGMFETQIKRLTPAHYIDAFDYLATGFVGEFISTKPSQFRVIPIEKGLKPENKIAAYDEIREVIRNSEGQVGVAECICKKAKDMLNDPCQVTDRREMCFVFREGHDLFVKNGWARSLTNEDAFDLLNQAEKEGLVLMAGNEEEVNFICCCCHCCCGLIQVFGGLPGPADFVHSNYMAEVNSEACNGCTKCEKRCQFDAIYMKDKKAVVKRNRCVGCGLCVASCKTEAIRLMEKKTIYVPPKTVDDLYDAILENKKSKLSRFISTSFKVLNSAREKR